MPGSTALGPRSQVPRSCPYRSSNRCASSTDPTIESGVVSSAHYDLVVLGAGPGGYVAAIRAAQLGKKVAVVEKRYWGGVCLNVGCIPSKALLRNAERSHLLTNDTKKFGIEGDATMSYEPTHARSRQVSDGIVKGVHFLMKKNKIDEVDGWGTLTSATSMTVEGEDGKQDLTFDNLIIATGATTRMRSE